MLCIDGAAMKTTLTFPSRGLGLVEMMIALTLSASILALFVQIFISSKQAYTINESLGRIQENARHAIEAITQDARMAGHLGDMQEYWDITETTDPLLIPPAVIAGECFGNNNIRWTYPMIAHPAGMPPLIMGQNGGSSQFSCIGAAQVNSDVLSLHYAGPDPITDANRVNGGIYLISNLTGGKIFRCVASGLGCTNPIDFPIPATVPLSETTRTFAVRAATYYVDTQNKLKKVALQADGSVRTDIVAEGVVSFQVQYGWDNNPNDNLPAPAAYLSADQVSANFNAPGQWPDWSGVRTVRVWLLLRNETFDNAHVSSAPIVVGDQRITPVPGYRYQLFVTTVASRNFHN